MFLVQLARPGDQLLWVPLTHLQVERKTQGHPVGTQMRKGKEPQCPSPQHLTNLSILHPSPLILSCSLLCKSMVSRSKFLLRKIVSFINGKIILFYWGRYLRKFMKYVCRCVLCGNNKCTYRNNFALCMHNIYAG